MSRPKGAGGEESHTVADVRQGAPVTAAAFDLEVAAGPEQGRRITVVDEPILVGTSAVCELQLSDPRVSRRHLSLEVIREGGVTELRVCDLSSTNGTFVNGLHAREVRARGGEGIQIGGTLLVVTARRAEGSTREAVPELSHFGRVIGASAAMQRVYRLARRVAASDISVVVEGETGTGKEQLAEAIHEVSARADRPFVVFDCTTVPPNLMEAALFGHERGAFTGAMAQKRGVFEQADGGTLFLDEIGDLDATLQPKLLRALQRREVQRVGGEKWLKVDVRVIAATRRDLDREVQAGRFRDDLFYRLAVARIELPPLRERRGDVELLAQHFWLALGSAAGPFPSDLVTRHDSYAWPGNVRELLNVVTRRHALREDVEEASGTAPAPIAADGAGDLATELARTGVPFSTARQRVIDEFESRYVAAILEQHGGNVTRAATASGIGRRYFHMLLARRGG